MTAFRAPKGTFDLYSPRVDLYQRIEAAARRVFSRHGFTEIRTPIFEETGLFSRGVGEGSDLVNKEMYTFTDRGGRSLTLRPEGTAAVMRALIENRLVDKPFHQRVYYIGPMFRYERPQKGRYRQFHQIGVEAVGDVPPELEADILGMLFSFLEELGLKDLTLTLNSIGDNKPDCQPRYVEELRKFVQSNSNALCNECQERAKRNVLRVLDCKNENCKKIYANAPRITEFLCDECRAHHNRLLMYLRLNPIFDGKIVENPFLVRGLDYYRRTAFEVSSKGLGSQDAILGGGRYDDLIKELGGPNLPGFGFGIGLDRLALVLENFQLLSPIAKPLVMILAEDKAGPMFFANLVAHALRKGGGKSQSPELTVYVIPYEKSPSKAFKWANRLISEKEAISRLNLHPFAILIGEPELAQGVIRLKNFTTGAQGDESFDRNAFEEMHSNRAKNIFNDIFLSFVESNKSMIDELRDKMFKAISDSSASPSESQSNK